MSRHFQRLSQNPATSPNWKRLGLKGRPH